MRNVKFDSGIAGPLTDEEETVLRDGIAAAAENLPGLITVQISVSEPRDSEETEDGQYHDVHVSTMHSGSEADDAAFAASVEALGTWSVDVV